MKKIIVPDYYKNFKCIANRCKHTCCKGWEVEIDDESLVRFSSYPDIMKHVETTDDTHFRLIEEETCPFLLENGYCDMIIKYGEEMLCQTCTDHPRFRNYWGDRIEMGLGLVCEEAARIILSSPTPMKLVELAVYDEEEEEMTDGEIWLLGYRDKLLSEITEEGHLARLQEYLIYRNIPDALYDDRVEERVYFIDYFLDKTKKAWADTEGTIDDLCEIVRQLSYDLEYDDEEKEKIFNSYSANYSVSIYCGK